MATHAANDLSYYLLIADQFKSDLAGIRKWNNLRVGFDTGSVWIRDLDYVQVNSVEVKSIPYKTLFYEKDGKLYLQNSLLPDRNIPSLLWTPIERALPVKLPPFNHNYFGISEQVAVRIVPSAAESPSNVLVTGTTQLQHYLETAPALRLQRISWCLLNTDKVLLMGTPLLPVSGTPYWMRNSMILPAGYDLDLFLLADALEELLNPGKDAYLLWDTDHTYAAIDKEALQPLSRGAFRQTMKQFSHV